MNTTKILERRAACRASHLDLWAMEETRLRRAVAAVNAGLFHGTGEYAFLRREQALLNRIETRQPTPEETQELIETFANLNKGPATSATVKIGTPEANVRQQGKNRRPFDVVDDGIALIVISGVMAKGFSKFADVNTIAIRQAVRMAAEAKDVRGIFLMIDSPGGTVAGTADLADDVRDAARIKPLRVHADDLIASAALWAGVAAERITASRTTEIGSIGTMLVIEDLSRAAEESGVEVIVISTGAMKGAGAPGTEITSEQREMFQQRVDNLNTHFLSAVSDGRRLRGDRLEAVSDGRVFIAEQARELGLIDDIMSGDDALASFRRSLRQRAASRSRAAALEVDMEIG